MSSVFFAGGAVAEEIYLNEMYGQKVSPEVGWGTILLKFAEMGHSPVEVKTWGMGTIGMFLGIWDGRYKADKERARQRNKKK